MPCSQNRWNRFWPVSIIAYYLVHSMAAGANFGELDLQAAANFRDAAARAGIRRIIYLGGLIPENPESVHLQSRFETGEVLRQGEVPVTEVRAGMIIGPGSAAFEVMRDLVNNLPLMITPRWVSSRSPPIALPDLLSYLAAVADLAEAAGKIYDAAGPEVLTYAEIMRRLASMLHRKILIIPVPVLSPKLSSYWLRLVTTVPVNIARALIDGLKHDVLANDEALRRLVPIRLHNLEESITAALEAERNHAIPAHWVEGSLRCRNFEPRYAYYAKQATGRCTTSADPAKLWRVICSIGNHHDFFALNALWWLRGSADWLVGGPSFRRKRRHPEELRVGDVVDAWRVIALQPQRKLTLLLEMKLPGAGVLEFQIVPSNGIHEVHATALLSSRRGLGTVVLVSPDAFSLVAIQSHDPGNRAPRRAVSASVRACRRHCPTNHLTLSTSAVPFSTGGCPKIFCEFYKALGRVTVTTAFPDRGRWWAVVAKASNRLRSQPAVSISENSSPL